jgi:hypothetical protein
MDTVSILLQQKTEQEPYLFVIIYHKNAFSISIHGFSSFISHHTVTTPPLGASTALAQCRSAG